MCARRLGAAFHLRLLSALCNDLIEGSVVKAEIQSRVDAMLALHNQHRQFTISVRSGLICSLISQHAASCSVDGIGTQPDAALTAKFVPTTASSWRSQQVLR